MYELWFLLHIYLDCLYLWKMVLVTWKLLNWYCKTFHMLELCLLLESCWIKLLWTFELSWVMLIMLNMCFSCFLKICDWIYSSIILIVIHSKHIYMIYDNYAYFSYIFLLINIMLWSRDCGAKFLTDYC